MRLLLRWIFGFEIRKHSGNKLNAFVRDLYRYTADSGCLFPFYSFSLCFWQGVHQCKHQFLLALLVTPAGFEPATCPLGGALPSPFFLLFTIG